LHEYVTTNYVHNHSVKFMNAACLQKHRHNRHDVPFVLTQALVTTDINIYYDRAFYRRKITRCISGNFPRVTSVV